MYMEGADERVVGYHTKKHTLKKKKASAADSTGGINMIVSS